MKSSCIFAAALVGLSNAETVTPVQKVIQLMEGMLAKGKDEKQKEEVAFAASSQFCADTQVEKKNSIADADDAISKYNADIEKFTADAERLTKEIAKHDEDMSTWTGDSKAAIKVRAMEKGTYDKTHKDYSESIDALERAIAVVKKQANDVPQFFVQVKAVRSLNNLPEDVQETLDSFLEMDTSMIAGAPEADAYESQTAGIIEMFEKLLDKFIAERTKLEKEEMNTKQAFSMLNTDLLAQIDQADAEKDSKTAVKAEKKEAKAKADGDLADTTSTRDADQKYLDDLTASCEQKASDFADRQSLRGEELVAIEKAIEIMSSDDVSGSADKHLPSLAEMSGSSFAQLRTQSMQRMNQERIATFLTTRAGKLGSKVLAALAVNVADSADPFRKVKKMIKDLIVRLMEEANAEAESKGWCDTELTTNEQTRNEKTEAVETLLAEIDELEASIAKLTEDISALTDSVAALNKAMSKATSIRQEEKATNAATVQDAQAAQTAVEGALKVLKDFYEKAGEAPAGGASGGGASTGVVGMLEVILSDFQRLEADTKSAEEKSQEEYDTFTTDSTTDKSKKETDIEHKTAKKQDQTSALTVAKKDLAGNQKELDAAMAYFDKLKPDCVDMGVDYDDRVARRKEEIQSLQEALEMLTGNAI